MAISKSDARRLAKYGAEMDARILRGKVKIGPEGVTLDGQDILAWLSRYADREIVLVAAAIDDAGSQSNLVQTCQRCGRDYRGDRCGYCADARARLRGT